jgi:ribosomal-protein-alanine N-acetyltransferase
MMQSDNDYTISLTNDPEKFEVCARMMSLSDPWITLGIDYDLSQKAFKGPCIEIYVAEKERQIAGFVILQICGTFKGYIQTICIDEKYRGKGLGKKLLHFSEERIAKISPNVFICVSKFNSGAIKLYYEFGFKLVGELKDFVKEGFDELLLRKTSGPVLGYDVAAGKQNT